MSINSSIVFVQNQYAAYLGILTAAAMLICAVITCLLEHRNGVIIRKSAACCAAGFLLGALISHIFYVLASSPSPDLSDIISIWHGGFSLIGMLAGYSLGAALCAWALGEHPLRMLDCTAPAMSAAIAPGMLSCVWTGEYVGSPVSSNALHFFPVSVFCRTENIWRSPLFWYMSVYSALLCIYILYLLDRKQTDDLKASDGELFALFSVMYCAPAGILETFRSDSMLLSPVFINKLHIMQSTQLTCAVLSAAGILILIFRRAAYNRFALRTLWAIPVTVLMYCGYCYDMLHIATVYDWLNTLWKCISAAGLIALAVYSLLALCRERKQTQ